MPADVFSALQQAGLVEELLEAVKETGLNLDAATVELLRKPLPAGLVSDGGAGASTVNIGGKGPAADRATPEAVQEAEQLDPNRRYLRVSLGKGRAFLSHLDESAFDDEQEEEEDEQGDNTAAEHADVSDAAGAGGTRAGVKRYYVIHMLCRGQRARSAPVPAVVEPDFSGRGDSGDSTAGVDGDGGASATGAASFTFDIQPDDSPVLASLHQLALSDPSLNSIHLVLVMFTQRTRRILPLADHDNDDDQQQQQPPGESGTGSSSSSEVSTDVIGAYTLDWRTVLANDDGTVSTLIQIQPTGPGPHNTGTGGQPVPVGLLPVTLQLLPQPGVSSALPRSEVQYQIDKSGARITDAQRAFFSYSKAWWTEYKGLHPSFKRRLVKIFGESETGEFLPVSTYVTPLSPDRVIDSPAEAARFVSLLPYRQPEAAVGAGSAKREVWRSLHSILASKACGLEDHAVLLCSLLIGFGLDAYVAIGTRTDSSGVEEDHCWVITRYAAPLPPHSQLQASQHMRSSPTAHMGNGSSQASSSPASPGAGSPARHNNSGGGAAVAPDAGAGGSHVYRVSCWEPLTGQRCGPGDLLPSGHVYSRVACVFNHDRFYACTAVDDTVATVGWDLEAQQSSTSVSSSQPVVEWKGMDPRLLQALPHSQPVPLSPPSIDTTAISVALEASLRSAIEGYRASPAIRNKLGQMRELLYGQPIGPSSPSSSHSHPASGPTILPPGWSDVDAATTPWDDRMSFTLQQAIAGYEMERVTGEQLLRLHGGCVMCACGTACLWLATVVSATGSLICIVLSNVRAKGLHHRHGVVPC